MAQISTDFCRNSLTLCSLFIMLLSTRIKLVISVSSLLKTWDLELDSRVPKAEKFCLHWILC